MNIRTSLFIFQIIALITYQSNIVGMDGKKLPLGKLIDSVKNVVLNDFYNQIQHAHGTTIDVIIANIKKKYVSLPTDLRNELDQQFSAHHGIEIATEGMRQILNNAHDQLDYALSPDGKYWIEARRFHNSFIIHTCPTRAPLYTLTFNAPSRRVAWSPDSRYIAVALQNKTLHICDIATHDLIHTFNTPDHVNKLVFSPRAAYCAASLDNHNIMVWDMKTGICLKTLAIANAIAHIGFFHESQLMCHTQKGSIRAWDLHDAPDQSFELTHCGKNFTISPDGTRIASISSSLLSSWIDIWDTDGICIKTLNQYSLDPADCCFSPNGHFLAVNDRSRLHIFDARSWQIIKTIATKNPFMDDNKKYFYHTVQFSSNGFYLLAINGQKQGHLFDTKNWKCIRIFEDFPHEKWGNPIMRSDNSEIALQIIDEGCLRIFGGNCTIKKLACNFARNHAHMTHNAQELQALKKSITFRGLNKRIQNKLDSKQITQEHTSLAQLQKTHVPGFIHNNIGCYIEKYPTVIAFSILSLVMLSGLPDNVPLKSLGISFSCILTLLLLKYNAL